jgi:hypothetical protein
MTQAPPPAPAVDPKSARAEAKAAKARAKALRPWYRKKRWWTLGLVLIVVVIAVAASGGSKKSPGSKVATGTVLLTRSGSGTASTGTFTAPTNWNLQWSYDCSSFLGGKGNFIVTVEQNPHSGTMAQLQDTPINQLGTSGSGTEHYHYGGGGVYLSVDSECTWTVTAAAA